MTYCFATIIPDHLLFGILDYLDVVDLMAAATTCRRWKHASEPQWGQRLLALCCGGVGGCSVGGDDDDDSLSGAESLLHLNTTTTTTTWMSRFLQHFYAEQRCFWKAHQTALKVEFLRNPSFSRIGTIASRDRKFKREFEEIFGQEYHYQWYGKIYDEFVGQRAHENRQIIVQTTSSLPEDFSFFVRIRFNTGFRKLSWSGFIPLETEQPVAPVFYDESGAPLFEDEAFCLHFNMKHVNLSFGQKDFYNGQEWSGNDLFLFSYYHHRYASLYNEDNDWETKIQEITGKDRQQSPFFFSEEPFESLTVTVLAVHREVCYPLIGEKETSGMKIKGETDEYGGGGDESFIPNSDLESQEYSADEVTFECKLLRNKQGDVVSCQLETMNVSLLMKAWVHYEELLEQE